MSATAKTADTIGHDGIGSPLMRTGHVLPNFWLVLALFVSGWQAVYWTGLGDFKAAGVSLTLWLMWGATARATRPAVQSRQGGPGRIISRSVSPATAKAGR